MILRSVKITDLYHYLVHWETSLQSSFVPGDSTANQLVDIYNTFSKALDDGVEVKAVFL